MQQRISYRDASGAPNVERSLWDHLRPHQARQVCCLSQNLGSLYKGLVRDSSENFKHLRKTRHTHHPVDDARGNAEALLHMKEKMGLKIKLI